jgi:hypothetical protein
LWGSSASAQGASQVSPRYWASISEGFGVSLADDPYASSIIHLPSVGVGYRFAERTGVELGATFYRSLTGREGDFSLTDQRTITPAHNAYTATIATIRGASTFPFSALAGVGVGLYHTPSLSRMDTGFHLFIETAAHLSSWVTTGAQLRLVGVPNLGAGVYSLALVLPVRTH